MFNLRFFLWVSKTYHIFVEDKRQWCHNNKLTNVNIMTFRESASKHEAFNEVLSLFNNQPELTRSDLFHEVLKKAMKQGEIGQQLIEKERNENK